MKRFRVIFNRVRRDEFGQIYGSERTISIYAADPGQAERGARARLPWRDRFASAKVFDWRPA